MYDINKECAVQLIGLCRKCNRVLVDLGGFRWWSAFYGRIIKKYNHGQQKWLIQFDNGDDNALIWYDVLLRYVDKYALTFDSFNLPANLIGSPEEEVTHNNERFVIDKLNWT